MNKFFGKASQKLAIALFVVCAGAALVFKTGAVQNFILNDLALMLIKRPLNYPDVWKHRLDILTHVLLIASFGFGFLYCGATVSRLRYFRDAGRELKDFFHEKCVFNRRNGRILLAIFAIAFLGYFALIRSGVGYLDDLDRSMAGFFGWMFSFGRVVTEALNLAIHGVHLLHDRSPLGQLIAMGFLSVASLVMALVFRGLLLQRGGANLKWYNVAAAMILVFNPYFLDGIAWKYDSPGMAASILFPLIPFLFIGTARLYTISSLVCVLGMYLSYQASSGIYVMMAIFVALLKYITEEWSLSETAKFCAKSAGCFIVASALFYLVTTAFFTAGASRTTNVAIGFNVARNIAGYFSSIRRDFNSLWKALSLLAMLAAAFAACKLSKKKMVVTLPIFIIALALALLLSQGGYIFLADYAHAPRYKYGFGALLAMLASISVLSVPSLGDSWKKALAAAPAVLLAWSFFSYASAFGNAHANQMKMELQYQALVMQDISELFPREEYPRLTLALVGQMPWSGEVKNLVKAYPITAALVIRRHGGGSMNAWFRFTMRYFDPTLVQVWGNNLIIGKTTLLVSRRYYDILLEEGTGRVIVECKMELTVNS